MSVAVGLTLPSFVADVEIPIGIAVAAEAAGLDAVFAYDHLFRLAKDGARRPAIECFALLGALTAETQRIGIGSLVTRASLRPAAVTAQQFASLERQAPRRMIAAIGSGDSESRAENVEYGVEFGTLASRVAELRATVDACLQVPTLQVWVGGTHPDVHAVAAHAHGWNRWGGSPDAVAGEMTEMRALAPHATLTWGGLVILGADDDAARRKAERLQPGRDTIVGGPARVAGALARYVELGVSTVIVGPVDSSAPENVELVAEVRARLA